jgi:lactate racemase
MVTHLAYGKTGLDIQLDDNWNVQIVEPKYVPGVANEAAVLREALRAPIGSDALASRVKATDRVGIIFNDITRATPNTVILPAILAELNFVPRENIILFDALGTHRQNSEAELRRMLGNDLVDTYRIVQNDSFSPETQVHLGRTSLGHEIWINRELMSCDFKILTGFIEPHFFAGFSGGGKAVMPGMAGLETILGNHCAENIANPKATWGTTWGNPLWEEVRETALKAKSDFLVNVTLNREKRITAVFAGDLDEAHAKGCTYVKSTAMVAVDEPFDIVITSNSGYPLDLNLYQAVKGMSAAAQIVRPGGAIVIASECWDGIPDHGLFGQLLREANSPKQILERVHQPGFSKQDQWQAQVQAQIQMKADVYVHSSYLSEEQIRGAMLKPAVSIEDTLIELVGHYGKDARICILPEGPVTIPYTQLPNA